MGLDYQLLLAEILKFRKELESRVDGLPQPFEESATTTTSSTTTIATPTPPTVEAASSTAQEQRDVVVDFARLASTDQILHDADTNANNLTSTSDAVIDCPTIVDTAALQELACPPPSVITVPDALLVADQGRTTTPTIVDPAFLQEPRCSHRWGTTPRRSALLGMSSSRATFPPPAAPAGPLRLFRSRLARPAIPRPPRAPLLHRLCRCPPRPPRLRLPRCAPPRPSRLRRPRRAPSLLRPQHGPNRRPLICGPRVRHKAALASLTARRGGGDGLCPLPRRPCLSSTAPPTTVTQSPAPTATRDALLMVLVTASSKLATISIRAQEVFDEMSHCHQPSASSRPAPVFTSQCVALMSAEVLHARAADQGAALFAGVATMAPASMLLSVLTGANVLLGGSLSWLANHSSFVSVRMSDGHETDMSIETMEMLIKASESTRGNNTSLVSRAMPPPDQMLGDEYSTNANTRSRVNRQFVLAAITLAQHWVKRYNTVPTNVFVLYTGTIMTEDGKEKQAIIDFEAFKPMSASLYLCDQFHTEALNELVQSDDKLGFIVMHGNGTLFATLCGDTCEMLYKFTVDLPKKHGRGQSALSFARLRMAKHRNYLHITPDFQTKLNQADMFDQRLRVRIHDVVDVSYGSDIGFNQAIELSAGILANVKFIPVKTLIRKCVEEICQDTGSYVFDVADTLHALEMDAFETLMVWENLDIDCFITMDSSTGIFSTDQFCWLYYQEADPKLAQILFWITSIAEEFHVTVYITNPGIVDSGGDTFITDPKKPAGDHVSVHDATVRLMLRKGKANNVARRPLMPLIFLPDRDGIYDLDWHDDGLFYFSNVHLFGGLAFIQEKFFHVGLDGLNKIMEKSAKCHKYAKAVQLPHIRYAASLEDWSIASAISENLEPILARGSALFSNAKFLNQVASSLIRIAFINSIMYFHKQWDPGGVNIMHRLEGKPSFKKAGMLGDVWAAMCPCGLVSKWAGMQALNQARRVDRLHMHIRHWEEASKNYSEITRYLTPLLLFIFFLESSSSLYPVPIFESVCSDLPFP